MEFEETIERLVEAIRDPHALLRKATEEGRGVVGYFCSYVPAELIHAAGFTPMRLLQGPPPGELAGRYMQPFCCSFARSLLEGLGNGTYAYLSAVVMPHTCDTIRNLSDLVESAAPGIRVFRLMVPTVTETPEALEFMVEELSTLKDELAKLASREVGDWELRKSIALYNRCRSALAGLRALDLGNRALYAAYLAFQLMDPEDFLDLLAPLSRLSGGGGTWCPPSSRLSSPTFSSPPADGKGPTAPPSSPHADFSQASEGRQVPQETTSGPCMHSWPPGARGHGERASWDASGRGLAKIAIVGGPVPELEVFDLMEEYGMRVAWDDLCTASRFASGLTVENGKPLRALAERYLRRRPCPTKLDVSGRREEDIVKGVRASGATGVVFAQQAFCEFHSFDYPGLKGRLDAEGIPSVRLDLESPFRPTGQMRTRLQALSEMMGEGG